MRLLPRQAFYGQASRVEVGEEDLLLLPERLMRALRGKRLAMIFQEPMTALNPVLQIGTQLGEAIAMHQSVSTASNKAQQQALLEEVEMPLSCLTHYPHQLSGGQKQRIVIAMALANHPDLLIADEPTTALDVTIQAQILSLLKKLQRDHQMSLLLITHDLGVVKAMADWVCVMYAGQLVEAACAIDFFKAPRHPYAQQMLEALPSFLKREEQLETLSGQVPTLDAMPAGCRFHPRCAHVMERCLTEVPLLQSLQEEESIRCHLYPSHTYLPALAKHRIPWVPSKPSFEAIMSLHEVSVSFGGRSGVGFKKPGVFKAVDGLSFSVYPGKTLALVGESGSGKTTVSRAMLRLQPTSGGDILFRGDSISTLRGASLRQFRSQVQLIFQDPSSAMNPRMTVEAILSEGLTARSLSTAKRRLICYQLLDQVNLARNSLSRFPHQFSGGQRQRICIARALATEPRMLVCDEPTSALDMSVQAQILNLLKSLQQERQLAYVFITHNMGVVSYLADDVIVMRHGKMVEQGSVETILTKPTQTYTQQLMTSAGW